MSAAGKDDHRSLKRRAVRGSAWTLTSYGAGQVLRFVSNVLLSYLLVREAFATMMIVNAIVQGLQMFSDIGLGPSIVQDRRRSWRVAGHFPKRVGWPDIMGLPDALRRGF